MKDSVTIAGKTIFWHTGLVVDQDETRKLEPLPVTFLKFLVEHQGEVVSKEQLLEAVWKNKLVSDDAIRRVVKLVRTALNDDAKSPRFIKTLPSQGYMFVAKVEQSAEEQTEQPTPLSEKRSSHISLRINNKYMWIMVAIIFILILTTFLNSHFSAETGYKQVGPRVEKLTTLDGFEYGGSYCLLTNTLLFTYKANANTTQAIYSKDLNNNVIKRLSFGNADIMSPKFSPNCKQVAYKVKHSSGASSYIADLDKQGLTNATLITKAEENREFVSWSADGQSLYFSGASTNAEVDNTEDSSSVISRYSLDKNLWKQLTFSRLEGRGDILAQESPDGKYLAVLRNPEAYRVSLLILDLSDNSIRAERYVPFYPNRIVWLRDQVNRLVISSRKGDFYHYDVELDELSEQVGNKLTLNDVFYHCGFNCFYMRQYDVNYSDIKELPNPFENITEISTIHIESNAADFNAVYGPEGKYIYFTKKHEDKGLLTRIDEQGMEEALFTYGARQAIHNLQIGPKGAYATGKLGNRVFVLNISTKAVSYISSEQEQAFFPQFSRDGESIYFSRLEQSKVVLQHFNIETNNSVKLEDGLFARYEDKAGNVFLLDDEYRLFKETDNNERSFIIQLGKNPYYIWQILKGDIYFTKSVNSDVYLYRFNLKSGELLKQRLFKNSRSYHFNFHPDVTKLLVAEALVPQSDLVKVVWQ
jgi:DNA-binding winged helix-turn-helix (wHTH) protein/Tol biopolymer transport system component